MKNDHPELFHFLSFLQHSVISSYERRRQSWSFGTPTCAKSHIVELVILTIHESEDFIVHEELARPRRYQLEEMGEVQRVVALDRYLTVNDNENTNVKKRTEQDEGN